MSTLGDVVELHLEAERLEVEATDLRIQAAALTREGGLCPIPRPPSTGFCCQMPYACMGRQP